MRNEEAEEDHIENPEPRTGESETDQDIEDALLRIRRTLDEFEIDELPENERPASVVGPATDSTNGHSVEPVLDRFSITGMVIVRTREGLGLLSGHLPGRLVQIGLQSNFISIEWSPSPAGRIIAALVDLGFRGELFDCEVWMRTHRQPKVRVVIQKCKGELRLVVNDDAEMKTLVDLPLLSGLD